MADVQERKYKILKGGKVTLRGVDLKKDQVVELPVSAGEHLVKEKVAKAVVMEVKNEDTSQDDSKQTEEELQAAYEKEFKTLDKKTRDNLYEVAKEIIEIPYDINKDPLIEAIIEADKTKAVLKKLEE